GSADCSGNLHGQPNTRSRAPSALEYYKQALSLFRQMGDKRSEAATLTNIGGIYDVLGDKHKALDYFEQTADLLHQVGDRWTESLPRYNIARVHEDLGNLAAAEEQLQI